MLEAKRCSVGTGKTQFQLLNTTLYPKTLVFWNFGYFTQDDRFLLVSPCIARPPSASSSHLSHASTFPPPHHRSCHRNLASTLHHSQPHLPVCHHNHCSPACCLTWSSHVIDYPPIAHKPSTLAAHVAFQSTIGCSVATPYLREREREWAAKRGWAMPVDTIIFSTEPSLTYPALAPPCLPSPVSSALYIAFQRYFCPSPWPSHRRRAWWRYNMGWAVASRVGVTPA